MRRMTLDLPRNATDPPARGDLLTSERACYRVLDVKPVESRVWSNRWRVELERIPGPHRNDNPPTLTYHGQRWHPSVAYRRGEGPADRWWL